VFVPAVLIAASKVASSALRNVLVRKSDETHV
jgi:hypothetical protein